MQTLVLDIQDSFMKEFLHIIGDLKDKVQLKNDANLEHDPYFYERQKQLQQDIEDIDSGKVKMISNEEFWKDIDNFTNTLVK
jgi:hypothetical protein